MPAHHTEHVSNPNSWPHSQSNQLNKECSSSHRAPTVSPLKGSTSQFCVTGNYVLYTFRGHILNIAEDFGFPGTPCCLSVFGIWELSCSLSVFGTWELSHRGLRNSVHGATATALFLGSVTTVERLNYLLKWPHIFTLPWSDKSKARKHPLLS